MLLQFSGLLDLKGDHLFGYVNFVYLHEVIYSFRARNVKLAKV